MTAGDPPRAGVVVALAAEARCLGVRPRREGQVVDIAGGPRVILSGMGPQRAARAAQLLVEQGVTGLVSWGTCGGLEPALASGDLLLPETVVDAQGVCRKSHAGWCDSMRAILGDVHGGRLVSAARPLASVADKAAARSHYEADAVDMESAAVAAVADQYGIPFVVVRVVCDATTRALPTAALAAVDAIGRPRVGALLRRAAMRPRQWSSLLAMGRDFEAAQRTLQDVARRALGPLGHPPGVTE